MADILSALDALDKAEKKKQPVDTKANTRKNAQAGRRRKPETTTRPRPSSLPPVKDREPNLRPTLSPPRNSYYSERPASLRKISFADAPRPSLRRLRIPTKTESLASGFPYDSRLFKYGVTAEEWNHFSREIVEAAQVPMHAHVPVLAWTWQFHKQKVTKGVKKQLLYESSDLQREMRRWNKLFKRQGFQVSLELPNMDDSQRERGGEREVVGDSKEEKAQVKLERSRFRMVITPNPEKNASIYSRSSSLARSITGEGSKTTAKNVPPPELDEETKEEVDGEG